MVQDAYENAETIKEKVKIMKKNKIIPGKFQLISEHCFRLMQVRKYLMQWFWQYNLYLSLLFTILAKLLTVATT